MRSKLHHAVLCAALAIAGSALTGFFWKKKTAETTSPVGLSANAPTSATTSMSGTSGHDGGLAWSSDLAVAVERARSAGKPVLVDFFATWCGPCQQMERTTFRDVMVQRQLSKFELVRIDVDQNQEVAQQFGVTGLPTVVCIPANGNRHNVAVGYQSPDGLLKFTSKCAKLQPTQGRTL